MSDNRFFLAFQTWATSIKRVVVSGSAAIVLALAVSSPAQASLIVNPGWDLFETQSGTTFQGVAFLGVPLGTFDFGGTIGVQNTGTADTIVHRLDQANAPSETIDLEMVALQLGSVAATTFGGTLPLDFYFITLQSIHGGPASGGTMTISFGPEPALLTDPHGTFDSTINVAFDLRMGALNGPIVFSDTLALTSNDVPWAHQASFPVLEIAGVNLFLNGADRTTDFFPLGGLGPLPLGVFEEIKLDGATHRVRAATPIPVPEPSALSLMGLGGFMIVALVGLGRKRKAG